MKEELLHKFEHIRKKSEHICAHLQIEDYVIQGMPDVSPPKWHLAHTTWFFETFVLQSSLFDKSFAHLFNSYYQSLNEPYARHQRGLRSRPGVGVIYEYRRVIDEKIKDLINNISPIKLSKIYNLIELGMNHEQQHQELLLMDIKYNFSLNLDIFSSSYNNLAHSIEHIKLDFVAFEAGLIEIGYEGEKFCFDNELPRHKKYLSNFSLAKKLVTNYEYQQFINDNGYNNPLLWLSDGFSFIKRKKIKAPLYWRYFNDQWHEYTFSGLKILNPHEPVCHISFYEADAFARWADARLPSEEEWEFAASQTPCDPEANFLEKGLFHPEVSRTKKSPELAQLFGDLWEWTSSSYAPYPGFRPLKGTLGEYNAQFMSNQIVLRGGSCASPHSHMRTSYRNFYHPDKRWHFCGIRLARK